MRGYDLSADYLAARMSEAGFALESQTEHPLPYRKALVGQDFRRA